MSEDPHLSRESIPTPLTLFSATIAIGLLAFYTLTLNQPQLAAFQTETINVNLLHLVTIVASLGAGILLLGYRRAGLHQNLDLDHALSLSIILSGSQLISTIVNSHPGFHFFIYSITSGCLMLLSTKWVLSNLRVKIHRPVLGPAVALGIVLVSLWSEIWLSTQHHQPAGTMLLSLWSWQVLLGPIAVAITYGAGGFYRHPGGARDAMATVLLTQSMGKARLSLLAINSLLHLIALGTLLIFSATLSTPIQELGHQLSGAHFIWLTALLQIPILKRHMHQHAAADQIHASLTQNKAGRLLQRRKLHDHHHWATTVGMRTASFLIDHDPNELASDSLTATLAHIRREEIRSFSQRLLGRKTLELRSVGSQLMGTLDPEDTLRPCVDSLNLLAVMYLDVMPIVERRLRGLTSLLPIIDPQLAARVTPEQVENFHARLEWLYHLEYQWVDQQLIAADGSSAYGITTYKLGLGDRNQIMNALRLRNRLGNFIWIGDNAAQRIRMEASQLAGILETCPLSFDDQHFVVALIKFEQLIPRLQKYYGLENWRSLLKDYEISDDASRVFNIISLQLNSVENRQGIEEILTTLMNYRWQGFREKDLVLHYLLQCYDTIRSLGPTIEETCLPLLRQAIQTVGYPSQLLHQAHHHKRLIRDANTLAEVCSNSLHPRFHEGWLFLCHSDPQVFSESDLGRLKGFLMDTAANKRLLIQENLASKSFQALLNLAPALDSMLSVEECRWILSQLIQVLTFRKASNEEVAMVFDGMSFMRDRLDWPDEVFKEAISLLQEHCLSPRQAINDSVRSVISNWQQGA